MREHDQRMTCTSLSRRDGIKHICTYGRCDASMNNSLAPAVGGMIELL
jgi:hypothetical protein